MSKKKRGMRFRERERANKKERGARREEENKILQRTPDKNLKYV
jgi:hypothetical protein